MNIEYSEYGSHLRSFASTLHDDKKSLRCSASKIVASMNCTGIAINRS